MSGFISNITIVLSGCLIIYIAWHFFFDTGLEMPENPTYTDSAYSVSERVDNLLSHMTLEEKIAQMALVEKNSIKRTSDISKYGIGAMLSGFGGKPENNTVFGWRDMVEEFIAESKQSRLGVPILYGVDAVHGHSNVPGFTVFPHSIGLGATGDAELVKKIAAATKDQMLATGINWSYSPTYDMPQDIRWGRVYEAFSDDPKLVSALGSAYIEGLQENTTNSSTIAVLATPKHFIGAGSMLWGTSGNENFKIDQGITPPDEKKLQEQYLPPFKKAVASGALSIMIGLNSWGDTKIAAESQLVNKKLKGDIGFTGFVVSDWYGVYEIPGTDYESAVVAINSGVDMVMLPFDYKSFIKNVKRAVEEGEISEARINDAAKRILSAKFAAGLFDEEKTIDIDVLDTSSHRELAREAVAKSVVLLKNQNNILPIATRDKTIFVAGSAANNVGMQSGAWTVEWQGIDGNWLPESTSIFEGIKAVASPTATVVHKQFFRDGDSRKAHIGIAVVGEAPYAEGWGDDSNPSLSPEDIETINYLQSVSEKVVVVIVTGRPLIITEEIKDWDALVVTWLPGSEGGGVADVLFGEKPFTGKLPLPWPAEITQLPILVNGITRDGSEVLFPRYFGLNPKLY